MEPWFQMVATIVCAVVASSGFWAYIQKRSEKKDVRTQMLIGLAHDRIVYLGMSYIDRGWITQDEYENLHDYLYKPYEKMGGNGSAKKVMSEVNKLPIHKSTYTMKNNSAVAGTISSKDEQYTVPQGYHDGSGKVGIVDTEKEKLVPANIREGITLLGVEGTMSGTEDAKPQAKTVTPKTTEQTVLPDTEEGYNYLSQVTVAAIPYQESENPAGGTTVTIG